ncbi:formyltetrahydrofolate deformylase [Pelagicoccus enzymogenes]|uniref:formyltetrahydrofolate deformylase n=1 Tax=Pelagicoccus enzymogenes TaxID=2773457 RepID=UPI00280E0C89|nr:formyltetrahydrofolate deformylase [Pelagicoccus enzymogenes]MDQ8200825.1 formyltetrahydrofolate deformylase [Pelagicoccus enzymogenes]
MSDPEKVSFRLVASCPDQAGIVAKVSGFIASRNASIVEAGQYEDPRTRTFFMRYVVSALDHDFSLAAFSSEFEPVAKSLQMQWRIANASEKQRAVILVSKFDHCLAYLLHRWRVGDLPFELPCVISNHDSLRNLVEWYDVPFHHIPIDKANKQAGFQATADKIEEAAPDVIVLARYMQIFPPWLCSKYRHRVINIHHSFLPSFVGARPYHQAEKRGVKLIGATCHYVTEELDAGPIIEQDIVRIKHNDTIADMMRQGKDVENRVLSIGLRYHLEDRILVQGNKTIVFD